MAEQSIRFGISDGRLRAATWKLFTPSKEPEVYLACRELNGELKASLHKSGQWHVAYSPKFFTEKVLSVDSTQKRFVQRWSRPAPLINGIILAYRIVTPYSSVTSAIGPADKRVAWIPNCPAGKATEIGIFIAASSVNVSTGWPGKDSMRSELVGSSKLPSGHSVCVVYWIIDMPDFSHALPPEAVGRFFQGKTRSDLKSAHLRAIAFGEHSDGSRVMYDIAVRDFR